MTADKRLERHDRGFAAFPFPGRVCSRLLMPQERENAK
jgi:hypothetical protein